MSYRCLWYIDWMKVSFSGLSIMDYYHNNIVGLKTLRISPDFPSRLTQFICITYSGVNIIEDLNMMLSYCREDLQ